MSCSDNTAKIDYKYLKSYAKAVRKNTGLRARVTDFIALAPQNDPFYVGTETSLAMAQWFASVWQAAGYTNRVHLRRVHYWLVSQADYEKHNGETYQNTDKDWKYLGNAAKYARYLGLVRIADIIDNKNPTPHINATYWDDTPDFSITPPELNDPSIYIYGIEPSNAQPYHLEIWCEKSTMNDVLLPVCRRYSANLVTFEGEVSVTACYDLVNRTKDAKKAVRVFYISDFDPAGNSMPAAMSRKVEYLLQHYGYDLDIAVMPLVLTLEQVQTYRLPRTPIKKSERRAGAFELAFGTGATELDALEALHPGVLAGIVKDAIEPYYSEQAAREVRQQKETLRQAIKKQTDAITARYSDEIAALQKMIDELNAVEIDAGQYRVDTYAPDENEDTSAWLFDSERDYFEQIEHYKIHKRGY